MVCYHGAVCTEACERLVFLALGSFLLLLLSLFPLSIFSSVSLTFLFLSGTVGQMLELWNISSMSLTFLVLLAVFWDERSDESFHLLLCFPAAFSAIQLAFSFLFIIVHLCLFSEIPTCFFSIMGCCLMHAEPYSL